MKILFLTNFILLAETIGDKCAKYQEIISCVAKHLQQKAI